MDAWAAQPEGVGDNVPTFGTSGVQRYRGRSNGNDLCFYSRQSLFSTVQL